MNEKTFKSMELDKILEILSSYAISDVTKGKILSLRPSNDYNEVDNLLNLTQEAYISRTKYNILPVHAIDDILEILKKAEIGAGLQPGELLKIAKVIRSARLAKKEIGGTGDDILLLKGLVSALFIDTELEKAISDSIAGENEVKDSASDELRSIRIKLKRADARLKEKLHSYTASDGVSKYLQDNIITIRNGRFVLPVKSECKGSIPGLIHDRSATGSTIFIEPYPIVELNNEIKSLRLEEAQEIERILYALSQMAANSKDRLIICQDVCIMLDIVYAKCAFSIDYHCIKPKLNKQHKVVLKQARHPLIDKNCVVPVNVSFGGDYRLLLITGPNTGGKTVCLKTVGLFCLMTYCGIFIPCEEDSTLFVFDSVYCDIGDEQSIINSLSTFSSHIVNLAMITDSVTNNSLVLLDELGGGTDPAEGAALAIGIIKYLEMMKVSGILTTHYGELKEYALLSPVIKNGCMRFDETTLRPTYELIVGIPGVSNALKIAKNYGLNNYILREAQNNLDSDKVQFELVLQNAEQAKSEAIKERDELSRVKSELESELVALKKERAVVNEKLERINRNALIETKRIVGKNVEKAESIIEDMKELLRVSDERSLLEAKHKLKEIEDIKYRAERPDIPMNTKPIDPLTLREGMKVFLVNVGSEAIVKRMNAAKKEAEVMCGNAVLKVKFKDLATVEDAKENPQKSKQYLQKNAEVKGDVAANVVEIKVLGLTVNEAIEVLVPQILGLVGQNVIIKIIHGKGTGALSAGIKSFLKNCREVKSFRIGGYYEGGAGVTVAELI